MKCHRRFKMRAPTPGYCRTRKAHGQLSGALVERFRQGQKVSTPWKPDSSRHWCWSASPYPQCRVPRPTTSWPRTRTVVLRRLQAPAATNARTSRPVGSLQLKGVRAGTLRARLFTRPNQQNVGPLSSCGLDARHRLVGPRPHGALTVCVSLGVCGVCLTPHARVWH